MASEQSVINTDPNIASPDDFYETLIETHRDLTAEQSQLAQCEADPAPGQPHRRPRGVAPGNDQGIAKASEPPVA